MEQFVLTSKALPLGARVLGFVGEEALSQLYSFEVTFVVDQAGFEPEALEGQRGSLLIEADLLQPFFVHGLFSEVESLDDGAAHSLVRARLTPAMHRLTQSVHSRVFTQRNLPAIIAEVLQSSGFGASDFELRLSQNYAKEEHVAQYKESDFAFLSRWFEREGLHFYFEQEASSEKLVIVDDDAAHTPIPGGIVRYHAAEGGAVRGRALTAVSLSRALQPGSVMMADYDYARPALEMRSRSDVSGASLAAVVRHGARFFDKAQGERLARIAAQALSAEAVALKGRGNARHLRAGFTFELSEHPRAELDARYLLRRVRHEGRDGELLGRFAGRRELLQTINAGRRAQAGQGVSYEVEIDAQPADLPYRAPQRTPWPRVFGFENGTVDGPAQSEYAQIDEQGRYAIKLHFDEADSGDGQASTWVRMAQPHGGSVEGFHFPLRKSTEVLIEFLDGDPDRPVIAGVMPNALTPSPVTQKNATKNVLQTGGSTRLEIEDASGGQYMHSTVPVQASSMYLGADGTAPGAHNAEFSSNGSAAFSYGTYFDRFVGGDKSDKVEGHVKRGYDASYSTTLLGDLAQTLQANHTRAITDNVTLTVTGASTESVTKAVKKTLTGTLTQAVTANVTENFQALHELKVVGEQTLLVGGLGEQTLEAGLLLTVNTATSVHTANAGYKLDVTPSASMHSDVATSIRGGAEAKLGSPETTVRGDETVDISGGSTVEMKAPSISASGSDLVRARGPIIEIKGGDVRLSGIAINFNASKTLSLKSDGVLISKGTTQRIDGGSIVDVHAQLIQLNLGEAPPTSGLGPEYDALLAADPVLAARIRLLLAAGWTIQWGSTPGLDLAQKIIVLDRALYQDPAAALAQFDQLTAAPDGTTSLLGMNPELLATFSDNQNDPSRRHENACGAYSATSLFMLYQGTHGGLASGNFQDNLGNVMPAIANNDPGQWAISHGLPLFTGSEMGSNGAWFPGSVAGGLNSSGVPATSGSGLSVDELKANIDNNVATMVAYNPGKEVPLPWNSTAGHWGTAVGYTDENVLIMNNGGGISEIPWSEWPARQELGDAASLLIPDGSNVSVPLLP
jgi:type VI secretion system secreted protein VgrG